MPADNPRQESASAELVVEEAVEVVAEVVGVVVVSDKHTPDVHAPTDVLLSWHAEPSTICAPLKQVLLKQTPVS